MCKFYTITREKGTKAKTKVSLNHTKYNTIKATQYNKE